MESYSHVEMGNSFPQGNTVGENNIAAIKIRNNVCYPLKMIIFPKLRYQYWTFLYCYPLSYCSSNFAIAKVVALFASILV